MQRSDSPARNVPAFWLGDPASGWRWPFEATFTAWKVWALSVPPIFGMLWLALPFSVLVGFGAWRLGRWVRGVARPVVVRGRNVVGELAVGALVLFALAAVPSPRAWLLPLPWYVALVAAPAVAVLTTRAVMRHVTPNTPLGYWLSLLPRVAAGPRARREPAVLAMAASTAAPAAPLSDIEYLALTLDPKELRMPTARPRVREVEFSQWLPANEQRAAETVAWAAAQRLQPRLNGDRMVITDGRNLFVAPGQYLVHDAGAAVGQRVSVLPPSIFARDYEETA